MNLRKIYRYKRLELGSNVGMKAQHFLLFMVLAAAFLAVFLAGSLVFLRS